MKRMDSFTGIAKISKTMRFELRPQGKTLENFKASGLLEKDKERAEKYGKVKKLIDAQHKALIERSLVHTNEIVASFDQKQHDALREAIMDNGKKIDWVRLADAIDEYRKSKKEKTDKDALEKLQKKFRSCIVAVLRHDEFYEPLVKDTTLSKYFKAMINASKKSGEDPDDNILTFERFACYFKGYQKNRVNIYSDEAQNTAASYRAVNVNFPTFLKMKRIFDVIESKYPEILANARQELSELIRSSEFRDIFRIESYGNYLSQSGIDSLNRLIGGYTIESGAKVRGINEWINLYRQAHEDAHADKALSPMPMLSKQILSDRESISFLPEMFENDSAVIQAVRDFNQNLDAFLFNGKTVSVLAELKKTLALVSADSDIYVDASELSSVSKILCGSWNAIESAMNDFAEGAFKRKADREKWLNRSEYTLAELNKLDLSRPDEHETDHLLKANITDAWNGTAADSYFAEPSKKRIEFEKILSTPDSPLLRERKEDIAKLKDYLDSLIRLLNYLKPLHAAPETAGDPNFYNAFDPLYAELRKIIPLYNRVRNYITQEVVEEEKIKLMFNNPTLADGWDLNKEKDNTAVLFLKDGNYYLGIMDKKRKTDFSKLRIDSRENVYRKMIYKLLPGPNKMLPKVFFSKANKEIFNPSADLLKKYQAKMQNKGETFDLNFCHELIDFFKASIAKHPDWSKFGFRFSDTSSYRDLSDFYKEISEQGYKIDFENIPADTVSALVKNGSLYLFQIYNKDFAAGASGKRNMHTIYWESLFSPENLGNVVIKLNGEAELFWRTCSITKPFVHHVGEKLVNRRDTDGKPIPEKIFGEIFDFVNKRSEEPLSPETKKFLDSGKVIIRDVKHEIIKDRRFTQEKFLFHVPVTINYKAPDKPIRFNDTVNQYLRDNPDVNIIGIDRGERHLIYLTLIDQSGRILMQKSFNSVETEGSNGQTVSTDYHTKLEQREKERDEARKSWGTIGKIKDLKSGYLSQVVHEITRLMIRHNAIIVLEDLNFGFKRGRFCIEKQVYQKFEKALIDKLNYLVFKDRAPREAGGCLNGYQLTDAFQSFEKLGKQTGFLFYVPAGYTSKIDPSTGFTNLFNTKKCKNAEERKAFFSNFDSICYDQKRNAFAFSFHYDKFTTGQESWKKDWTVYSADRRLVFDTVTKTEKEIFPTAILCNALKKRGVSTLHDGFDLLAFLKNVPAEKSNAEFFADLFYAFDRTLQMRNSCAATGEDYIQSPVLNHSGAFFDSRRAGKDWPENADANGAFHIALKGLYLLRNAFGEEKPNLKIEHKNWFEFAQKRNS